MAPPLRSRGGGGGGVRLWRFDMPRVVAAIVAATFVISVAAAITARNGFPQFAAALVLDPARLFRGEVWRLVTWQLVEPQAISLLFTCAMLYWFGGDLCRAWGTKKFAIVYLALSAITGAIVAAVAEFLWPEAGAAAAGGMVIAGALSIAWAATYPEREILLFFVLPARGQAIIFATLFLEAVFTAYYGVAVMLPFWVADVLVLVYVGQLRRWYLQLKLRSLTARSAAVHKTPKRKVGRGDVLRIVRDDDDDDDPRNLPN